MNADILEQVVEEYLQHSGYFTRHNVRFKPRRSHPDWEEKKDDVSSDVDVIGLNPLKQGADRVWVVSCKAWQSGFHAASKLRALEGSLSPTVPSAGTRSKVHTARAPGSTSRELSVPKWSEAFRERVRELTGQSTFRYFIAVTKLIGSPDPWQDSPMIKANLANNPFGFLTMENNVEPGSRERRQDPAATSIGRFWHNSSTQRGFTRSDTTGRDTSALRKLLHLTRAEASWHDGSSAPPHLPAAPVQARLPLLCSRCYRATCTAPDRALNLVDRLSRTQRYVTDAGPGESWGSAWPRDRLWASCPLRRPWRASGSKNFKATGSPPSPRWRGLHDDAHPAPVAKHACQLVLADDLHRRL